MPEPEDSSPLPALPVLNQDEWGDERETWDLEVKRRLEGYLSPDELEAWILELAAGGGVGRQTVTITTAELDPDEYVTGTVNIAKTFILQTIEIDAASRTRLYSTLAQRNADLARPRGVDPDPEVNVGLITDWALYEANTGSPWNLSPQPTGTLPTGIAVPYTITNEGAAAAVVTVTLTFLSLEQ